MLVFPEEAFRLSLEKLSFGSNRLSISILEEYPDSLAVVEYGGGSSDSYESCSNLRVPSKLFRKQINNHKRTETKHINEFSLSI